MKIKSESKKKSQLDKANEALKAIAADVTASDRKQAPFSEPTIVKYLKGEGRDLDTALKVLRFLRGRIAGRDKEIAGAL